MKFISYAVACVFLFCSCNGKKDDDFSWMYPPYKLIKVFSKKIKLETGLVLAAYGINFSLPKGYQYVNGIGNFHTTYLLTKARNDVVTIEEARKLLVFLVENFLQEINSNQEVIPDLDVYPFNSNLLKIIIHMCEKNKVDLGQGVARICFSEGKIEYERFDIYEYTNCFNTTRGKHFKIHEESYEEALDIVRKQGALPAP